MCSLQFLNVKSLATALRFTIYYSRSHVPIKFISFICSPGVNCRIWKSFNINNYNIIDQCAFSQSASPLENLIDDLKVQKYVNAILETHVNPNDQVTQSKIQENFEGYVANVKQLMTLNSSWEKCRTEEKELCSLIKDLEKQEDKEFLNVVMQEHKVCLENIAEYKRSILQLLIPRNVADDKDVILELSAGVGGQEAMLFTKEMFDLYCIYARYKGWDFEVMKYDVTDLGGVRVAHIGINGRNAYRILKYESGVHRVQRVPKTEKSGRVHTSTMTVAILPQPEEIDIVFNPKDIKLETKSSSGPGGQNVNKNQTCVRLTHLPTGIVVECQVERSLHLNKEIAFKSLRARLYQKELEESVRERNLNRKLQVGTAGRAEKVRTYNFPQDRITDHRIHQSISNINYFFMGGEKLDNLLSLLENWSDSQLLCKILEKYDA